MSGYRHHKKDFAKIFGMLIVFASIIILFSKSISAPQVVLTEFSPEAATKTAGCVLSGPYPDPACTPGAIFPTVTKDEVCMSGYSSNVRNVSEATKDAVYAEYGITSHASGEYEVDHFISLELGGTNDIANLFPEAAYPTPGFHEKDKVENYLHKQVCDGAITLPEAQKEISTDWVEVYNQDIINTSPTDWILKQ